MSSPPSSCCTQEPDSFSQRASVLQASPATQPGRPWVVAAERSDGSARLRASALVYGQNMTCKCSKRTQFMRAITQLLEAENSLITADCVTQWRVYEAMEVNTHTPV